MFGVACCLTRQAWERLDCGAVLGAPLTPCPTWGSTYRVQAKFGVFGWGACLQHVKLLCRVRFALTVLSRLCCGTLWKQGGDPLQLSKACLEQCCMVWKIRASCALLCLGAVNVGAFLCCDCLFHMELGNRSEYIGIGLRFLF